MRKMSYRIEWEDGNEGYLISNAEASWEAMPEKENIENPPIRIKNVLSDSGCHKYWADIEDCIDIDDGDTDMSPDFRDGYLKALRGELEGWKLIGVQIHRSYAQLLFGNIHTYNYEFAYVSFCSVSHVEIAFESENMSGGVDEYILRVSEGESSHDGKKSCYVRVSESGDFGKREIVLNRGPIDSDTDDKDWIYAYITEYR